MKMKMKMKMTQRRRMAHFCCPETKGSKMIDQRRSVIRKMTRAWGSRVQVATIAVYSPASSESSVQ